MHRYGITEEEWDALYEDQCGMCAICLDDLPRRGRRVHTDHKGLKVRGLLCGPCNMRLGWYEENKRRVDDYLAAN